MPAKSPTFESTQLAKARFTDVDLHAARFDDVNLTEATFSNVSLAGAVFDDIDFSNAVITNAKLDGMTINGIPVAGLLNDPPRNAPPAETPWYDIIAIPALLRHARTTYGVAMRKALEDAGFDDIPGNGLYVIGGLALGAGDAPLAELIRDLRITKQAAGQLVDTLVTRGYLTRSEDPQDRRRQIVTLTDRGHAAAAVQGNARARIDALLAERIGKVGVGKFRKVLAALIAIGHAPHEDTP